MDIRKILNDEDFKIAVASVLDKLYSNELVNIETINSINDMFDGLLNTIEFTYFDFIYPIYPIVLELSNNYTNISKIKSCIYKKFSEDELQKCRSHFLISLQEGEANYIEKITNINKCTDVFNMQIPIGIENLIYYFANIIDNENECRNFIDLLIDKYEAEYSCFILIILEHYVYFKEIDELSDEYDSENNNKLKFVKNILFYKLLSYTIVKIVKKINDNKSYKNVAAMEYILTHTFPNKQIAENIDITNSNLIKINESIINYTKLSKQYMNTFFDKKFKNLENLKCSIIESSYKTSIETLTNKMLQLQNSITEKNLLIKQKNAEIKELNDTINELNNIIKNSKDEKIAVAIDNDTDKNDIDTKVPTKETEHQNEVKQQIGYIHYKQDEIVFYNSNGISMTITNPKNMFITDRQFVIINSDNEIIKTLNNINNNETVEINFNKKVYFCAVDKGPNVTSAYISDINKSIIINDARYSLRDNQVVMVDLNGNILSVYKAVKFNLDYYIDYVRFNYDKCYYVNKILHDMCIVINMFENTEEILKNDYDLQEHDIILMNTKTNTNKIITQKMFYLSSSFYKRGKILKVVIENNHVYGNDKENRLHYIYNMPMIQISEGALVKTDEDYNYIEMVYHDTEEHSAPKFKPLNNKVKVQFNELVDHSILVVGNPKYKTNYKLSGLKNKLNIETIDGSEQFVKIEAKASKFELIIVCVSFISHDNMWKIKDNFKNVIYVKNDGANYITNEALDYFSNLKKQASK